MGVRGLQSYIENHCPEAMVQVNLPTVGHRYYRQYRREAVLVVDGMSCLRKLYHPGIPWIFGGQWKEYIRELQHFLDSFKRARIKLVFFFDGRVEKDKRAVWVQRRLAEREKVAKIFEYVKLEGREPQDDSLCMIPINLSGFTVLALKSLGATVYCTTKEADFEISKYCGDHQCLGILGQDTDYIFYNMGEYFSSQYLDTRSLITVSYSREVLCRKLRIPISQLPLLASLLGNDVISRPDLADFHQYLAKGRVPGFPRLIQIVANYAAYFGDRLLSDKDFRDLDSDVFRDSSKFGLLRKSVRSYYLEEETCHSVGWSTPQTINQSVLELAEQLHLNAENVPSVLNIMVTAEVDSGVSFEDESSPSLPSSAVLLRPIKQRQYGLTYGVGRRDRNGFGELSSEKGGTSAPGVRGQRGYATNDIRGELIPGKNAVREWRFHKGHTPHEPEIVPALPLDRLQGGTPPLEYLWFDQSPQADDDRLLTYLACMDCTISMASIHQIPPELLLPCSVLHYLVKHVDAAAFRDVLVNAFVAVNVCVSLYDADRLYHLPDPLLSKDRVTDMKLR
ncbi:constitutive coactivator of peroxisome proliferator-activated receptor gamma-like isoform X2 [Ptychodera flava]|uniref:constitutive coactivator of peroxisome proliferator-activated receptor gamma-like isoform X2 n=1 Tax=Ptychodera flava TaxID=63121 RepID=UPI00396A7D07